MSNDNEKCCVCFDLRLGAFLCAYIHLLYVLEEMIRVSVLLIIYEPPKDEADPQAAMVVVYIMFGSTIVMSVLYLAFTIFLIVALHKDKPKPVLVFIKFQYFLIGMTVLGFIRYLSYYDVASLCYNLLALIITVYFVTVLKSYHKKMLLVGTGPSYMVA
ncbi:unnamed protein product [Chrysodeixis includens]|uniref:Uncharacterized protein n=1 Tax=Chrysodeixis includens TaxID=689277 RepID=A0A9P0C2E2_CHRIL|nr:unnamed protein product [Chrysodeixis includens]